MAIDYQIIEKNPDIRVEITQGGGSPLINLRLVSQKESGQQEYIYPAVPKEIFEILAELSARRLIDEVKYEKTRQRVLDLEAKLPVY